MTAEVIQIFGFAIYLLFLLLFLWAHRIPRTNPGSGYWAASIGCALVSRLLFYLLLPTHDLRLMVTAYACVNILEKPLLAIGLARFLNLKTPARGFWIAACLAELWLLLAWVADFTALGRMTGYSIVNGAILFWCAWAIYRQRHAAPGKDLYITALASLLTGVHWITSPFLVQLYPAWLNYSFMLGIALVIVLYFSLLVEIFTLFQQRLVEAENNALAQALLDPLTGLSNKRYMTTLFNQALLLATRPHHMVGVFYIDLDDFKPVNDSAGHATGDEVLRTIAHRFKDAMRSTDICSRVGGDEFVVIASQLENETQITTIAEKLLVAAQAPIQVKAGAYQVGASIGIALYPQHGHDLNELMICADLAMYHIKRTKKGTYNIYSGPQTEENVILSNHE